MSSTVASSPWPASARSPDAPHWRLAQEVAQASGAPGLAALQWRMVRHPSFAPGRLLQVFAALCLVALILVIHGAAAMLAAHLRRRLGV